MCTQAYREALTRDLACTASSAAASTTAPGQRHAAEVGRDGVAGRQLRRRANPRQNDSESRGVAAVSAAAESSPAMALGNDATVVDGEAIDQR